MIWLKFTFVVAVMLAALALTAIYSYNRGVSDAIIGFSRYMLDHWDCTEKPQAMTIGGAN
jgi:hypothetical protein